MKVLFYSSSKTKAGKLVLKTLLTIIPEDFLEIYRTVRSLSDRLINPLGDLSIAVLFIDTQKELSSLLMIQELLKDMRIIVILPDREKATASKGHRLGARFLSYKDSDFSNLAAVLQHMVEKMATQAHATQNHDQGLQN